MIFQNLPQQIEISAVRIGIGPLHYISSEVEPL